MLERSLKNKLNQIRFKLLVVFYNAIQFEEAAYRMYKNLDLDKYVFHTLDTNEDYLVPFLFSTAEWISVCANEHTFHGRYSKENYGITWYVYKIS